MSSKPPDPCKHPRPPALRGLLLQQIKRNIITALSLSALAGFTFKVLVVDGHKKRYAEFYRNYDINETFNSIRNLGLFDSCKPD